MLHHPIIIAGGIGERCRPITTFRPKCLIPINGVPILQLQLEQLISIGYKSVSILLGYMADEVKEFLNHINLNIDIQVFVTPIHFSSLDRLVNALISVQHERLLVLYCDNLIPSNVVQKLSTFSENTFVVQERTEGNISISEMGATYISPNRSSKTKYVELGYFLVSRSEVMNNYEINSSLVSLLILISKRTPFLWLEIEEYYSLSNFEQVLLTNKNSKILYLDRDGIICAKPPSRTYVLDKFSYQLEEKNINGLTELAKSSYLFVVCTNQPAVGLGLISAEQLKEIHRSICLELIKKKVHILNFATCEHSWVDECQCRKPKPGLLLESKDQFKMLSNSSKPIYIGDQISDREAAESAGFQSILVNNSTLDDAFDSILDAVDIIQANNYVEK